MSGHQWPSVAISGHPWPSVVIRGHQWSSVALADLAMHSNESRGGRDEPHLIDDW